MSDLKNGLYIALPEANYMPICKHGDNPFALVKRRQRILRRYDRDVTARHGSGISNSNHRRYRSRIGGFKTMSGRALGIEQTLFAFRRTYTIILQ